MYFDNNCRVKVGKDLSQEFKCTKSLLRAYSMSPILFKIYIDVVPVLTEWSKKCKRMGLRLKEVL